MITHISAPAGTPFLLDPVQEEAAGSPPARGEEGPGIKAIAFGIRRAAPLPEFGPPERRIRLTLLRHPRARSTKLTVDIARSVVRLTLPPRGGLAAALAWVETRRGWIEAQLARRDGPDPLAPGTTIPFEGRALRLDWDAAHPRMPRIESERLLVGGPAELVPARVLRWLRAEAAVRLDRETRALAARHGIAVTRVGVGDAKTRWGSCSASGDIRYSWRLILAPPEVRAAVVAHELAHRRHMDHSPAFHAAVAELFGRAPTAERAWLRAHGTRLQGFARGG